MMPVVGRLKSRSEFLEVAAAGAKWVTPGLVLQMRRRPAVARPAADAAEATTEDEQPIRVGFTVSRKVGNAVRRNRARRRLRAAAEVVLPEAGRPGCDYVLIGRQQTLRRPYGALVQDLRTAVARIGRKPARQRPGRGSKGG